MEADAIHELTVAYALDALDEHDEREYEEHLARCPSCREELASLTEAATLLVSNLAPAPRGKTYEAWVIQNRSPRRAGTFGASTPLRLSRPVPNGAVVAVTLERHGGVDSPTGRPITSAKA